MTIKCIVFDLDNTLWDCDPVIIRAEQKFYQWLLIKYPQITEKFSQESLVEHRVSYMQTKADLHHNLTQLRKEWMYQVAFDVGSLHKNKSNFDSEFIEEGFNVFWQERNNVVFYEGALDMLERLSKRYSLGVITNGNASVDYIGIGHFFDFSLSSENAGVSKPHEDIFHQAIRLSNYQVENMLYVGDDPKCDVLGPQKIGMKAIWYNPKLIPWPGGKYPSGVIRKHSELEDKICQL